MTKSNPTKIDEDEVGVVGLNELLVEANLPVGTTGCDVEQCHGQRWQASGNEEPATEIGRPVETTTSELE